MRGTRKVYTFLSKTLIQPLHFECSLTLPVIFKGWESRADFFDFLKLYDNKKHSLVFFDNASERNDKDDFYVVLNSFLESDSKIIVMLMG